MITIRMVVKTFDVAERNAEGGCTVTIAGTTVTDQPAHCVLTFGTGEELRNFVAALQRSGERGMGGR
jgi:hypothetical protein